jgi:hypothetical protein
VCLGTGDDATGTSLRGGGRRGQELVDGCLEWQGGSSSPATMTQRWQPTGEVSTLCSAWHHREGTAVSSQLLVKDGVVFGGVDGQRLKEGGAAPGLNNGDMLQLTLGGKRKGEAACVAARRSGIRLGKRGMVTMAFGHRVQGKWMARPVP